MATNPPAFSVNSALEKFESRDKDFRCMSLSDLTVELGKESFHLDVDSEKKLTKGILKLLQDDHSQVQELAIKCIGPFSKKLTKDVHVQEIVTTLGQHLQSEKKDTHEMREIASNAFKNVINSINDNLGGVLVTAAIPLLIKGIKDFEKNQDIVYVSLEDLNELLARFVSKVSDKNQLIQVVQPQLRNKRQLSRKEAGSCLGHLAAAVPNDLFVQLINTLLKGIQEAKGDELRSYVHTVSYISRSASERIGKFLSQIVPLLLKYADSSDDTLRDDCFQCLETLILRCPREVTPFLREVHELCLKFLKLENLLEEEGSDMETEESEEEEEEESEHEDEDDEDMTWKVRRAATKCLAAIINSRPELLSEIFDKSAVALIGRFKRENEENVRADVYATFISLLRQTSSILRRDPSVGPKLDSIYLDWGNKTSSSLSKFLKTKGKSVKGRAGGFTVLKELAQVSPNVFKDTFGSWLPGITLALGDKGTGPELKREALQFLKVYFATTSPKAAQQQLKPLNPLIFKAIKDKNSKIASAALRVGSSLVSVLRAEGFDAKPYLKDFFAGTLEKLKTADTEVSVKESSVACMSLLVANFSTEFKSELPSILDIFVERIGNEITAQVALKAFETISNVQPRVELHNLPNVVKTVTGTLTITSQQQTSLSTLGALIRTYGAEKPVIDQYPAILAGLSPFVSDSDLQLAQLALSVYSNILQRHPAAASGLNDVVPKAIHLLKAAQLPASVRSNISSFLAELNKAESKNFNFDSLHKSLLAIIDKDSSPNVIANVARGIGAISSTAKSDKQDAAVAKYEKDTTSKDYHLRQLSFLVLGEFAANLPSHQGKLLQILLQNAANADEATRLVVADSLGKTLSSIPKEVLPKLLEKLKSGSALEKSVVISAIRYAVLSANPQLFDELNPAIPTILGLLKDGDTTVRREIVSFINSLLRHKSSLITSIIADFIPQLYDEAKLKPELIHTIELGTIKVTVDNGYDNRVAAFECISLLLDLVPQLFDTKEFIPNQLVDGLKNQPAALVILSHAILLKLINLPNTGASLAGALDKLLEPLVLAIVPPDPTKKEGDEKKVLEASDEEVIRGSFRVISALSRLPETQGNAKLDEFLQKTAQSNDLSAKMKESENRGGLRDSGHIKKG